MQCIALLVLLTRIHVPLVEVLPFSVLNQRTNGSQFHCSLVLLFYIYCIDILSASLGKASFFKSFFLYIAKDA